MKMIYNRNRLPTYIICKKCQRQILRARDKLCQRCRNDTIGVFSIGINNNDGQVENERKEMENIINLRCNIQNEALRNQGFISTTKSKDSVRFFTINLQGFRPDYGEKIEMLKQAIIYHELDVILMSSPDRR